MKKKIIALLLVLTFIVSGTSAFAANIREAPNEASLLSYDDISLVMPELSVSGTSAAYKLTVRGSVNVTKLSAVLQLQKLNSDGKTYSNYGDPWTASTNSNYLLTSGTKSVASGGTYRLKVTVTPYIGAGAGTPVTEYS